MDIKGIAREELTSEITANTRDTFRLLKLKGNLEHGAIYVHLRGLREKQVSDIDKQIAENWRNNNALVDAYADNEISQ